MSDVCSRKVCCAKTGVFLISLLLFAYIGYIAPPAADDFFWADSGYETVGGWWYLACHYGNGRLLGNFIVQVLMHSKLLRTVFPACIIAFTIMLIPKLAHNNSPLAYSVSFLCVVGMNARMVGDTITCASCVVNYFTPLFMQLAAILAIEKYQCIIGKGKRTAFLLALVLWSFSAQLFIEHSAIAAVFLALVLVAVACLKNKELLAPSICYLISAVAGAAVMLTWSRFFAAPEELSWLNGFQQTALGSIGLLVKTVAKQMQCAFDCVSKMTVLAVIFAILVICTFAVKYRSITKQQKRLLTVIGAVIIAIALFRGIAIYTFWDGKFPIAEIAVNLLWQLTIIVSIPAVLIVLAEKKVRLKLAVIALYGVISVCPMLVVTSSWINYRLLLQIYVAAIVFALYYASNELRGLDKKRVKTAIKLTWLASAVYVVVMVVCMTNVKCLWESMSAQWEKELNEPNPQITVVPITCYYYKSFTFDEENDLWQSVYSLKGKDFEFVEVDYDEWIEMMEAGDENG